MKKIVVAIDGLSSSGKSTLAKKLAKAIGYLYVDTGAMYRAVSLFAIQSGFFKTGKLQQQLLIDALSDVHLRFVLNPRLGFGEMYLNQKNVEQKIRSIEVSKKVSKVAAIPQVRRFLVVQQKQMGEAKGLVMDGRDIGTVVFPNAELKLFLTASEEKRTDRRYQELLARGDVITRQEVLENIRSRDFIDIKRKDSPLKQASDAVRIDNSDIAPEKLFKQILDLTTKRIEQAQGC